MVALLSSDASLQDVPARQKIHISYGPRLFRQRDFLVFGVTDIQWATRISTLEAETDALEGSQSHLLCVGEDDSHEAL